MQALIAVGVVKFALGMETINTPLFVLTAIITSYTFIAIIILILQLTTIAGNFPLELIPAPLQIFNTVLLMTYSVQAFKGAISTGNLSFVWMNNGIFVGFTVACLAITFGYFALLYTRKYSKETIEA